MTDIGTFKKLSLLTTVGVLVVTACTIHLRGGDETPAMPKGERLTDEANSDLARCRSVTAAQTADYQHCRDVWAENRRRFFGKKNGPADPGQDDSTAGLASAPKDQSRIPLGYPPLALPEVNKP